MVESVGKAYKPWLILSMAVLVGSLFLLAIAVGGWFYSFGEAHTPLWENVLAALATVGIVAGFGGFIVVMAVAAVRSARDKRKAPPAAADQPPAASD